eukprot:XP_016659606.1 PREDICTED: uncharacterized protein LOC100164659 [Acyrthosiphon pisum]
MAQVNQWPLRHRFQYVRSHVSQAARSWYLLEEFRDWDTFVQRFKTTFVRTVRKADLWRELEARIQEPNEPTIDYFYAKLGLCRSLDLTFDDTREYILEGLRSQPLTDWVYSRHQSNRDDFLSDIRDWERMRAKREERFGTVDPTFAKPSDLNQESITEQTSAKPIDVVPAVPPKTTSSAVAGWSTFSRVLTDVLAEILATDDGNVYVAGAEPQPLVKDTKPPDGGDADEPLFEEEDDEVYDRDQSDDEVNDRDQSDDEGDSQKPPNDEIQPGVQFRQPLEGVRPVFKSPKSKSGEFEPNKFILATGTSLFSVVNVSTNTDSASSASSFHSTEQTEAESVLVVTLSTENTEGPVASLHLFDSNWLIWIWIFVYSCSHIRENTIASLKEAANKGADLVEFDVQLTKDLVPIINHDFVVSMATKSKTNLLAEEVEMVQIPLKDFSFEQLQKLKIYHVKEPYSLSETHFLNDVRNDYQPFPKLEKAFTDVDTSVGFNIELKWTMKLQDGTYELENPFDMNLFVDTILKTTFEYAGSRSIVFSCFHPDVCTMLKMKQNRYPILFLTQGVTVRYPSYADPRCHSIQNAVYHATCHDLLGVNVHSEDLLRDPLQIDIVKQAGLALFCWGDDNNCKDVANKFKKLGVNAVIYDKLDKIELLKKKMSCSTKNPDVFIANNYCDQNDILLSNQQSLKEDPHLREDNEVDKNRYFMDVGKATFQNQCSSTETLWNEKINDSKSQSRKQRFDCIDDGTLEPNINPTKSKKSKADI